MKKWYLIKTKPRQEQIAILNLERQHYYVYCPSALINQKNVVLFPGYLFIQLDSEMQNWSPIKSTKGVLNFVRFPLFLIGGGVFFALYGYICRCAKSS